MRGPVVITAVALVAIACSSATIPPEELPPPDRAPVTDADSGPGNGSSSSGNPGETCATVAPNNRCGLDPQCGCEANETCDITNRTTGATSCITGGSATLGRPCYQTGDCAAGLACIYGACRPYCKTPRSKCNVGGTDLCVEVLDTNGVMYPNAAFCTINCDPRDPSGVCGTNACHWFPSFYAPNSISDCNYGGTTPNLGECFGDSDCLPGHACVPDPNNDDRFECERWCRIGQPGINDCTGIGGGFSCEDFFGPEGPTINGVKEGLCRD